MRFASSFTAVLIQVPVAGRKVIPLFVAANYERYLEESPLDGCRLRLDEAEGIEPLKVMTITSQGINHTIAAVDSNNAWSMSEIISSELTPQRVQVYLHLLYHRRIELLFIGLSEGINGQNNYLYQFLVK